MVDPKVAESLEITAHEHGQTLVGKLEIHEEAGQIVLKNVRIFPHALPDPKPGEQPHPSRTPGADGLVEAVVLTEMPTAHFLKNHAKIAPDQILVFKGACLFHGGAWRY